MAGAAVVGDNSVDGRGDNGVGSSDGGCINSGTTMSVTMAAAVAVMVVAEATATETVIMAAAMAGGGGEKTTINKRWEC